VDDPRALSAEDRAADRAACRWLEAILASRERASSEGDAPERAAPPAVGLAAPPRPARRPRSRRT